MAPVHFGALVFDYQAIDVIGSFDLLNSSSKAIMGAMKFFIHIDDSTYNAAPEFVFHHIGLTKDPVQLLSSNVTIVPDTTVDETPEVDCLLIGGTYPVDWECPAKYADYIKRHVKANKPLFTTCTGAAAVAVTGALDGRTATINRQELEWSKKEFPNVNWVKGPKWVVDGNIWTGTGAVAGMDMIAHWIKEQYGLAVMIQGASGLDFEPRDIDGNFVVIGERTDEKGNRTNGHIFP